MLLVEIRCLGRSASHKAHVDLMASSEPYRLLISEIETAQSLLEDAEYDLYVAGLAIDSEGEYYEPDPDDYYRALTKSSQLREKLKALRAQRDRLLKKRRMYNRMHGDGPTQMWINLDS